MAQHEWLATTAPETGALLGVEYLGLVRIEDGGRTFWVAGRFVFLHGSTRHDWMEPFRNDFESESQALAYYAAMTSEWDHAIPYAY